MPACLSVCRPLLQFLPGRGVRAPLRRRPPGPARGALSSPDSGGREPGGCPRRPRAVRTDRRSPEGMSTGAVATRGEAPLPPRALALLLLLFSCLARWAPPLAVDGQPIIPCLAPLQWEGRTVEYDHASGINTRAAVTYDCLNQRLRILEERKGLVPCKKFFEYIFLYKEAVLFQIEQVTKQCSKIPLSDPWDPYDIPANSTYEDQYYIGGPGDQIMVQEWSDRKRARKLETWVGVYTVKDCYPVQETYTKNYSVTTSTRFFDLKLGIRDPSVFIPPSTCQEAQPKKMSNAC